MASNNSWMPAQGRHRVEIGSSLARSLKTRKLNGEAPPPANKRSHLPDKDFYSFRYNHKPPSVDLKKPGMIEFKKNASSTTTVILEQPSVQAGESAMFRGQETALNKNDCVLIYDEDTGTFTLEKLDACIQLTSDRSLASIIPVGSSPTPSIPPTPRGNTHGSVQDATIDQDILDLVDDDITPASTSSTTQKQRAPPRREEEEEDEDGFPKPNRTISKPAQRPLKPMPKPRAKPTPAAASPPLAASSSKPPPPLPVTAAAPPQAEAPPRPRAIIGSKQGKHHQQRIVNGPPVEDLNVPSSKPVPVRSKPVPKPPKQAPAPPPPPPAPAPLALPGSFSAQTTLPSSSMPESRTVSSSGRGRVEVAPPPPVPAALDVLEESEDSDGDSWDEVATSNAAAAAAANEEELMMLEEDIFGGEDALEVVDGEDDDFQRQLELEMANMLDEEEEEDEDDMDMEPTEIPVVDGPISLNALAGGGGMNGLSDDEYSSSEESDDDD